MNKIVSQNMWKKLRYFKILLIINCCLHRISYKMWVSWLITCSNIIINKAKGSGEVVDGGEVVEAAILGF